MNGSLNARVSDLVLHNRIPYTRDDGEYDPTMPSASHFLPLLDPKPSAVPVGLSQASTQQSYPQPQFSLQGIIPVPDIASQKLDNDPSGPSAALRDPSAFQSQADIGSLMPPPPGAISTPDNDPVSKFAASPLLIDWKPLTTLLSRAGHTITKGIPEDESWWHSGYDAAGAGKLP